MEWKYQYVSPELLSLTHNSGHTFASESIVIST